MITRKTKILLFLILGHLFVLLGVIGIFVPLLPTTPFILLATYFYSKSSKKFHTWLTNHKLFGQLISDWEKYGVISKKSKWISCTTIIFFFSFTIVFVNVSLIVKSLVALSGFLIMTFIISRPSQK